MRDALITALTVLLVLMAGFSISTWHRLRRLSRSSAGGEKGNGLRPRGDGGGRADSVSTAPGPAAERPALPPRLGVRPVEPFEKLADRLEAALDPEYRERLQRRVLAKRPGWTEERFETAFFELKRYFLMNLVLGRVPMFSDEADEVWHEMLMFTRDYQSFCDRLAGTFIHHAPHDARTPMPEEKAWFDWVYTQLFLLMPWSGRMWNGFFRFPLGQERVRRLHEASDEALLETMFNGPLAARDSDVRQAIDVLIRRAREHAAAAAAGDISGPDGEREKAGIAGGFDLSHVAAAFVAYSLLDPDGVGARMEPYVPDEMKPKYASDGDGGVPFVVADSPSDRTDVSSDAGGGAGGDGGSACGSGCGSGCGGGCGS